MNYEVKRTVRHGDFVLEYIEPAIEPPGFTRGDWQLDRFYEFHQELRRHLLGGEDWVRCRYVRPDDVRTSIEPCSFETVQLAKPTYDRLRRQAEVVQALMEAFECLMDFASNREMARLSALARLDGSRRQEP